MGIIDRLSTLIRSNINDLISRAENPQKVLEQLIVDMRSQLAKAKQQVASAIADEKRLSAQAEQEKKLSEDWEKRAVLAVQEGRDDLAKQELLRYNEHVQNAVQLHETWVKHREETDKLKNSLRALNDKIEEAKRKKNILIARQKRAEAHKRIQETMGSISDKSAFETFERMAEQIEHEERKLIASAEVNEELSGDSLIKQFQGLEVKADADQQLLALKQKMGLLPGGTQEQARALGAAIPDARAHGARQSFVWGRGRSDRRRGRVRARLVPRVRARRGQGVHRGRERAGHGVVHGAAAAALQQRIEFADFTALPVHRRARRAGYFDDAARVGRRPIARDGGARVAHRAGTLRSRRSVLASVRHLHRPRGHRA